MHPEIEKRGLLDIFLHARLRNRMVLTRVRGAAEVFRAKIRLQHAVWVHSAEVDALFRFIRWKGNPMIDVERARPEDREIVSTLLWENGMDYLDPIEDYALAREGKQIAGIGRVEDYPDAALIRPLVVNGHYRNQGIGWRLLEMIIPSGKPTLVVASGDSVAFYKSFGFRLADWNDVPAHQKEECEHCGARMACNPLPMIFTAP